MPISKRPKQGQIGEFAAVGETDFKAGNYDAAVRDWRHAMLDDPSNGTLLLMFAQALFATGKFDEAAGAVQQGMLMLPAEQWGVVVKNYTELYPKVGEYTKQLRALETAVKSQPDSPARYASWSRTTTATWAIRTTRSSSWRRPRPWLRRMT